MQDNKKGNRLYIFPTATFKISCSVRKKLIHLDIVQKKIHMVSRFYHRNLVRPHLVQTKQEL